MPSRGALSNPADKALVKDLEDTMIDAYGHDVVRRACAEAPSKISLGAKLLRDRDPAALARRMPRHLGAGLSNSGA